MVDENDDVLSARIVQEYEAGSIGTRALAKRHGVSRYRVQQLLKDANVDTRRNVRTPQPAPPEIVAAYEKGATLEGLAAEHGMSFRSVRLGMLEAGVTLRPPKVQLPPLPPGMVNLYENGASIRQVGAKFGHSYCQTRRMLLDAGVTLRPRGRGASVFGKHQ